MKLGVNPRGENRFFKCQVVFIPEKYQENHEEMVKLCKIHNTIKHHTEKSANLAWSTTLPTS